MSSTHCTFINALCPTDLCELPYGHPFTRNHRHMTGTQYGSAGTSYPEQIDLLRSCPKEYTWDARVTGLAPEGTPPGELIRLGQKLADELWPEDNQS